jgi:nucleoside phosphorylase
LRTQKADIVEMEGAAVAQVALKNNAELVIHLLKQIP